MKIDNLKIKKENIFIPLILKIFTIVIKSISQQKKKLLNKLKKKKNLQKN